LGDILKMAALKIEIDYIKSNNLCRTEILVPNPMFSWSVKQNKALRKMLDEF